MFCPVCCGECLSLEQSECQEKKAEAKTAVPVTPKTKEAAKALESLKEMSESLPDKASTGSRRALHEDSDKKCKASQERQAAKIKRLRTEQINVKRGDIVAMKVDQRDRAQHNCLGLVGVVLRATRDTGTSIIATEAGVIARRGRAPTYIKFDEFEVKTRFTVRTKLREIREKAPADESFMPEEWCTIRQAHEHLYGKSTHARRAKCRCKKGCHGTCSCRRQKRPCSSLCTCHGKCGNYFNPVDPSTLETPLKDH